MEEAAIKETVQFPWQQLRRRTNCFYKSPKSLKLPENDLEHLYQKVQIFFAPSVKPLRSAIASIYYL